jgi:hypothetical protein
MNICVHQLPGRLRLYIPALKGNATTAEKLASQVNALQGIKNVAANTVTGSLLIRYDITITNVDECFAILNVQTRSPRRSHINRATPHPAASRMAQPPMG